MTKLRPPVSFQRALTRIADVLGWEAMGEMVGKAGRTVLDWSDPDTSAGPSIEDALTFDIAYRRAGGEGAPLLDCYQLRLKTEQYANPAAADELNRRVARTMKEGGEANQALVIALAPNATAADRALARRELEESIEAQQSTLALLTEGTGLDGGSDERASPGGEP